MRQFNMVQYRAGRCWHLEWANYPRTWCHLWSTHVHERMRSDRPENWFLCERCAKQLAQYRRDYKRRRHEREVVDEEQE